MHVPVDVLHHHSKNRKTQCNEAEESVAMCARGVRVTSVDVPLHSTTYGVVRHLESYSAGVH